ncbi:biotin/lipoyl-binding carrier protein [Ornithinimicrobium pekingense]|uniref:Biotinylated protein TB7.3 n=1 Tax=Ornithinimicrobium pekingense TaxID=384677 RepID=A0ABQ2FA61_9MICO|nr:biotin/lipoyl-binding carrier protein [Ornithinimicrobium pekingense]GGK73457.1 biotinylated protein TB7.3 [Ornithinimicrobium pekingense]
MPQQIASELVASVAQVHVTVGQRVEAGEEVVLLESMKMEIPLLAEAAGTVVEVHVSPGDVVQEGDVVVVIG